MKNIFKTMAILIVFAVGINGQSKMKVTLNGGLNSPMSDMGELYNSGFGGSVGALYQLSDSWDVGVSVGYASWSADSDYWSSLISEAADEMVTIDADIPLTVVPVMLDVN